MSSYIQPDGNDAEVTTGTLCLPLSSFPLSSLTAIRSSVSIFIISRWACRGDGRTAMACRNGRNALREGRGATHSPRWLGSVCVCICVAIGIEIEMIRKKLPMNKTTSISLSPSLPLPLTPFSLELRVRTILLSFSHARMAFSICTLTWNEMA